MKLLKIQSVQKAYLSAYNILNIIIFNVCDSNNYFFSSWSLLKDKKTRKCIIHMLIYHDIVQYMDMQVLKKKKTPYILFFFLKNKVEINVL